MRCLMSWWAVDIHGRMPNPIHEAVTQLPSKSRTIGCQIVHDWGNGEHTAFLVTTDNSYPDALDQTRAEVLRLFSEGYAFIKAMDTRTADE